MAKKKSKKKLAVKAKKKTKKAAKPSKKAASKKTKTKAKVAKKSVAKKPKAKPVKKASKKPAVPTLREIAASKKQSTTVAVNPFAVQNANTEAKVETSNFDEFEDEEVPAGGLEATPVDLDDDDAFEDLEEEEDEEDGLF